MSLDQPSSSEDKGNLTPQGILDALNADDTEEVQPEDKIDLEDTDDDDPSKAERFKSPAIPGTTTKSA